MPKMQSILMYPRSALTVVCVERRACVVVSIFFVRVSKSAKYDRTEDVAIGTVVDRCEERFTYVVVCEIVAPEVKPRDCCKDWSTHIRSKSKASLPIQPLSVCLVHIDTSCSKLKLKAS